MVLETIRRLFKPMSSEWDMAFVESPAKALELMGKLPFDVIVTDMRMGGGMNGVQLLEEVVKRHPKTIRFVLSGYADPDLILDCVGTAHQYLSKPCQAQELKDAISRASKLDQSLQDEHLRQLLARLDKVPTIPSLYVELMEKLQDPEINTDAIA